MFPAASAARTSDLVPLGGTPVQPPSQPKSSWSELTRSEQKLHLRAQRAARTSVAALLLHKMGQVAQGRASKNLYATLRTEIDAARHAFRREFMEKTRSMVDYLHLELLRVLAKDDAGALGPEYPGPML